MTLMLRDDVNVTWRDASGLCGNQGGSLVVLPWNTLDIQDAKRKTAFSKDQTAWIGNINETIDQCAYISYIKPSILYENCSVLMGYLCQSKEATPDTQNTDIVVTCTLVACILILALALGIVLIFKRRHGSWPTCKQCRRKNVPQRKNVNTKQTLSSISKDTLPRSNMNIFCSDVHFVPAKPEDKYNNTEDNLQPVVHLHNAKPISDKFGVKESAYPPTYFDFKDKTASERKVATFGKTAGVLHESRIISEVSDEVSNQDNNNYSSLSAEWKTDGLKMCVYSTTDPRKICNRIANDGIPAYSSTDQERKATSRIYNHINHSYSPDEGDVSSYDTVDRSVMPDVVPGQYDDNVYNVSGSDVTEDSTYDLMTATVETFRQDPSYDTVMVG